MKKYKSKIITLLLAAALGSAVFGGVLMLDGGKASAAATATPSRIFTAENSASVKADETTTTELAFVFPEGGSVSFKRDLALKWYKAKGEAQYLSMKFAFKDTNFKTLTLTFETAPAAANKDKKSVNKILFENTDGKITAKVNDGEAKEISDPTSKDIALAFSEKDGSNSAEEGQFFVTLNGETIGMFEDVGADFAEYFSASATTPMVPFAFKAEMPDGAEGDAAKSTLIFKELNGQTFELDADQKITDNAKPVLVVNERVASFTLGTPFSLDYEVIDVIDTSVTKTMEYYQYAPKDFAVAEGEEKAKGAEYKTLSTSTYFFDTDVYKTKRMEYISVRFKLTDDTFTSDEDAAVYELAWYATESFKPETDSEIDYIKADRNAVGPHYTCITNDDEAKESTLDEENEVYKSYQEAVTEAAKKVYAGSNSYIYLPAPIKLIQDDDTNYKNLKYSIYYKTQSSDSASSSTSLSYDNLKLTVSSVGMYEFKILATDKAGNPMKYYLDKYKTKVTGDNIWDIEAIPSFTFSVSNNGISVEEPKNAEADTGYIDVSYNLSDFTVLGLSGYKSEYGLYFFDVAAFQKKYKITTFTVNELASVSFESLKEEADLSQVKGDDYVGYYAALYAKLLSERLGIELNAEDLLKPDGENDAILRKIEEFDSTIDEDKHPDAWKNSDNDYQWYSSSKSFKPQAEGSYLMFAVFTDSQLFGEKAAAYKAINVEAPRDIIAGETEWLKNNIASVILFSVAAVMLIIVIILLVVKPSDETLEDVEDGKGKKSKKNNKDRKDKKSKAAEELDELDKPKK